MSAIMTIPMTLNDRLDAAIKAAIDEGKIKSIIKQDDELQIIINFHDAADVEKIFEDLKGSP